MKAGRTSALRPGVALPRLAWRRRVMDRGGRWLIGLGGLVSVGSAAALLIFLGAEVYPLLDEPQVTLESSFSLAKTERVFAPVVDEYRRVLAYITEQGTVRVVRLGDGAFVSELVLPSASRGQPVAAASGPAGSVFMATADRRLVGARLRFYERSESGELVLHPRLAGATTLLHFSGAGAPRVLAAVARADGGVAAVFVPPDGVPHLAAVTERPSFLGAAQRAEFRHVLPLETGDRATAVAIASGGDRAFVGSRRGFVQYWDLRDMARPRLVDTVLAVKQRGVSVTALRLLIGDQSLVAGDSAGGVAVLFPVRDAGRDTGWHLERARVLQSHAQAVTAIAASPRGRSFLTADAGGQLLLHHSTAGDTLAELPSGVGSISHLLFAPKADGALAVGAGGRVAHWRVGSSHPEVTLRTLFSRTWYEGYEQPAHVWQSSGGSDASEPKLGFMPLIFGSLKGTLYALIFAVPVAILGALYTSQFAHPRLRAFVKPVVEMMAAVPSVVLGFLGGLWLAPAIEPVAPGVLAALLFVPLLMLGTGVLWRVLPASSRRWLRPGTEALVLIPLIVLAVRLCLGASPRIEGAFFGGDFRHWLLAIAGLHYDQRNCLVIGFAMGFAVIPIIFTIAEDALSSVPQRLVSGSLALGATAWQTARRIVLPAAGAGIFSAIMIGFGRAVGETMIVLMATGNTPIMEWNLFSGMRALSANLAVEMPEAPQGGTLYRVLFLTALLLLGATLLINTAAELVRARLRRRLEGM